jgi:urease accessory protein
MDAFSPREAAARSVLAMSARASLVTERVLTGAGRAVSRILVLRSQAPLVLRPTLPKGAEPMVRPGASVARVSLASGAAGPLGGDDLKLDIHVRKGSVLVLKEVSAMLLLPGARGGCSHMHITVTVENDATFVWLPEPLIAAHGCDHVHHISIALEARARLFMREELLLGRHRERPGNLTQHLCVRRAGRSLFHQRVAVGPRAKGWDSPAVLGGRKCIGSVLVVNPDWGERVPDARAFETCAALLPLAGPAIMVSALADDTLALRGLLDHGTSLLGSLWTPDAAVALTPEPSAIMRSRTIVESSTSANTLTHRSRRLS